MALDQYGCIWDSQSIRFSDLPTLAELVRECDTHALTQVISEDHARCYFSTSQDFAERLVDDGLLEMKKKVDSVCKEENHSPELVFLPSASYVLNSQSLSIARRMDGVLVSAGVVDATLQYRRALGGRVSSYQQAQCALERGALRMRTMQRDYHPFGLPFSPHGAQDVLGYRVWMNGTLCQREQYMMIGSVLWELLCYQGSFLRRLTAESSGNNLRDAPSSSVEKPRALRVQYREKMASVTGALNHNAFLDCLDAQIDLGHRLGRLA